MGSQTDDAKGYSSIAAVKVIWDAGGTDERVS